MDRKLTRAQLFAQLAICAQGFRHYGKFTPTRTEATAALVQQTEGNECRSFAKLLKADEPLVSLCHEALHLELGNPASPAGVLSSFEFVWERYCELTDG